MVESKFRTTPFQKVILIVSAIAFVALAAITASIPLNQPGRQETESTTQKGTENLNAGDTAWVIMATVFGFVSGPAVSYLYGMFLPVVGLASKLILAQTHRIICLLHFAANIYGKDEHQIVLVSLVTSAIITTFWIVLT